MKWKWAGHVGRMKDNRWTIKCTRGVHKVNENDADQGGDLQMTSPNSKVISRLNYTPRGMGTSGGGLHLAVD